MKRESIILYWKTVLSVSLIPLTAVIFSGNNKYYYWGGIISFAIVISFGFAIFFWIHLLKCFIPLLIKTLSGSSRKLTPLANYLSNSRILGPITSWCIRAVFFFWFFVLLMSDVIIRAIISKTTGVHEGTGLHYSPISASDSNFQPLGLFEQDEETKKNQKLHDGYFPEYNKNLALSLGMASKIAYEDVPIIKYELEKAGYNMKSFKPVAYKNVCGYIVEKDDNIILVFRGTNPLNIQNCLTDIRALLCNIESSSQVSLGLVHEGFYEAIGEDLPMRELPRSQSQTIIELSNTSLISTLRTVFSALKTLIFFASQSMITHIYDPVDHRYLGEDARSISAYSQAIRWISKLCKEVDDRDKEIERDIDSGNESDEELNYIIPTKSKKRLYIAGHSLGGGLATVFLFKLLKNNSQLLNIFAGIYTYGQPNVGDINFAKSFGPKIAKKMFHHAYNNDAVPRVPTWNPYSSPPGNLVFIDTSFSIYMYLPDPITNIPTPIRGISFLHLSGLLNLNVIRRMRNESWLRILFRIMFPFFINDHFPGDYTRAIRDGIIKRVDVCKPGQVGGLEKS